MDYTMVEPQDLRMVDKEAKNKPMSKSASIKRK